MGTSEDEDIFVRQFRCVIRKQEKEHREEVLFERNASKVPTTKLIHGLVRYRTRGPVGRSTTSTKARARERTERERERARVELNFYLLRNYLEKKKKEMEKTS